MVKKCIEVENESYSFYRYIELNKLLSLIDKIIDKVPAKHCEDICIKIEIDKDWNTPEKMINLSFCYNRPETKKEQKVREAKDNLTGEIKLPDDFMILMRLIHRYPGMAKDILNSLEGK